MVQYETYELDSEYVSKNFCNYINNLYSLLNCNRNTLRLKISNGTNSTDVIKKMYETYAMPMSCKFVITLKDSDNYNVMEVINNIAEDIVECLELDRTKLLYKLYYYTNNSTKVVRMEISNKAKCRKYKFKKLDTLELGIYELDKVNFKAFAGADHAAYIVFDSEKLYIKSEAKLFNKSWVNKRISYRKDM